MALAIDIDQLGRDLWLPETVDDVLRITPTGDIASLESHANLQSALRRRLGTSPGDLLHRPEYGAGVIDELERANTPARRAQLANAVRRNVLRDPRVRECTASVAAGRPGDATRESALTVDLAVTVTHTSEREQLSTEFSA